MCYQYDLHTRCIRCQEKTFIRTGAPMPCTEVRKLNIDPPPIGRCKMGLSRREQIEQILQDCKPCTARRKAKGLK